MTAYSVERIADSEKTAYSVERIADSEKTAYSVERIADSKKGFTLIELLIVISVIAILIGIALPRFKGVQDEGRIVKAAGELKTLQAGVESFYIHQSPKAYPAIGATWQNALTTATPTVIVPTALLDPFNTTVQYKFFKSTNGNYYVIFSVGPDGTAGITGTSDAGVIAGTVGDDIYIANGTSSSGGF